VSAIAGAAHHRDDLLNRWWVGGVLQAFVARRATAVKAGHGRRRPTTPSGIKKRRTSHQRRILGPRIFPRFRPEGGSWKPDADRAPQLPNPTSPFRV
jgi:hypothetical protein